MERCSRLRAARQDEGFQWTEIFLPRIDFSLHTLRGFFEKASIQTPDQIAFIRRRSKQRADNEALRLNTGKEIV